MGKAKEPWEMTQEEFGIKRDYDTKTPLKDQTEESEIPLIVDKIPVGYSLVDKSFPAERFAFRAFYNRLKRNGYDARLKEKVRFDDGKIESWIYVPFKQFAGANALKIAHLLGKDMKISRHKLVEEALQEGKPVPEEVLGDYPELEGNKMPEKVKGKKKEVVKEPWEMTREEWKNTYTDHIIGDTYYSKYGEPIKIGDTIEYTTLLTGKQHGTLISAKNIDFLGIRRRVEVEVKDIDDKVHTLPNAAGFGVRGEKHEKYFDIYLDDPAGYERHADIVKKALKEGKTVPKEVLADYPELVEKTPLTTSETEKLKIDAINEVLSETRIKKVHEPYTAMRVMWDNIDKVDNQRELIRIGDARWNTATSKYVHANYDKLVDLTKVAMKRYNERLRDILRTDEYKREQVWIDGCLKERWRCPICGRAAPGDFCMVHSDVDAVDIQKDKRIREMVLEVAPLHGKRGLKEHVLEYLEVKHAKPFVSEEWLAKQEKLGKTFYHIKPQIDALIEDYFETEERVKETEELKEEEAKEITEKDKRRIVKAGEKIFIPQEKEKIVGGAGWLSDLWWTSGGYSFEYEDREYWRLCLERKGKEGVGYNAVVSKIDGGFKGLIWKDAFTEGYDINALAEAIKNVIKEVPKREKVTPEMPMKEDLQQTILTTIKQLEPDYGVDVPTTELIDAVADKTGEDKLYIKKTIGGMYGDDVLDAPQGLGVSVRIAGKAQKGEQTNHIPGKRRKQKKEKVVDVEVEKPKSAAEQKMHSLFSELFKRNPELKEWGIAELYVETDVPIDDIKAFFTRKMPGSKETYAQYYKRKFGIGYKLGIKDVFED